MADLELVDALTDSPTQIEPDIKRDFISSLEAEPYDDVIGEKCDKTDYVPLLDDDEANGADKKRSAEGSHPSVLENGEHNTGVSDPFGSPHNEDVLADLLLPPQVQICPAFPAQPPDSLDTAFDEGWLTDSYSKSGDTDAQSADASEKTTATFGETPSDESAKLSFQVPQSDPNTHIWEPTEEEQIALGSHNSPEHEELELKPEESLCAATESQLLPGLSSQYLEQQDTEDLLKPDLYNQDFTSTSVDSPDLTTDNYACESLHHPTAAEDGEKEAASICQSIESDQLEEATGAEQSAAAEISAEPALSPVELIQDNVLVSPGKLIQAEAFAEFQERASPTSPGDLDQETVSPASPPEFVQEAEVLTTPIGLVLEVQVPASPVALTPEAEVPASPVALTPEREVPASPVALTPAAEIPASPVALTPAAEIPASPVALTPVAEIPASPVALTPEAAVPASEVAIVQEAEAPASPTALASEAELTTSQADKAQEAEVTSSPGVLAQEAEVPVSTITLAQEAEEPASPVTLTQEPASPVTLAQEPVSPDTLAQELVSPVALVQEAEVPASPITLAQEAEFVASPPVLVQEVETPASTPSLSEGLETPAPLTPSLQEETTLASPISQVPTSEGVLEQQATPPAKPGHPADQVPLKQKDCDRLLGRTKTALAPVSNTLVEPGLSSTNPPPAQQGYSESLASRAKALHKKAHDMMESRREAARDVGDPEGAQAGQKKKKKKTKQRKSFAPREFEFGEEDAFARSGGEALYTSAGQMGHVEPLTRQDHLSEQRLGIAVSAANGTVPAANLSIAKSAPESSAKPEGDLTLYPHEVPTPAPQNIDALSIRPADQVDKSLFSTLPSLMGQSGKPDPAMEAIFGIADTDVAKCPYLHPELLLPFSEKPHKALSRRNEGRDKAQRLNDPLDDVYMGAGHETVKWEKPKKRDKRAGNYSRGGNMKDAKHWQKGLDNLESGAPAGGMPMGLAMYPEMEEKRSQDEMQSKSICPGTTQVLSDALGRDLLVTEDERAGLDSKDLHPSKAFTDSPALTSAAPLPNSQHVSIVCEEPIPKAQIPYTPLTLTDTVVELVMGSLDPKVKPLIPGNEPCLVPKGKKPIHEEKVVVALDYKEMKPDEVHDGTGVVPASNPALSCEESLLLGDQFSPKSAFSKTLSSKVPSPEREPTKALCGREPSPDSKPAKATDSKEPSPDSKPAKALDSKEPSPDSKPAKALDSEEPSPDSKPAKALDDQEPSPDSKPSKATDSKEPSPDSKPTKAMDGKEPSPDSKPAKATDSKETSPDSKPTKALCGREPSPDSKPSKATDSKEPSPDSKPAKAMDGKEPSPDSKPTKAMDGKEPSPDSKPAKSTDSKEPSPDSKPAKAMDSKEPSPHSKPAKATDSKEPSPHSKPAKATDSKEPSPHSKPAKATDGKEPSPDSKPTKAMDSKEPSPDSKPAKALDSKEPSLESKPAKATDGKEPSPDSKPAKATDSKEPSPDSKPAKATDSKEPSPDSKPAKATDSKEPSLESKPAKPVGKKKPSIENDPAKAMSGDKSSPESKPTTSLSCKEPLLESKPNAALSITESSPEPKPSKMKDNNMLDKALDSTRPVLERKPDTVLDSSESGLESKVPAPETMLVQPPVGKAIVPEKTSGTSLASKQLVPEGEPDTVLAPRDPTSDEEPWVVLDINDPFLDSKADEALGPKLSTPKSKLKAPENNMNKGCDMKEPVPAGKPDKVLGLKAPTSENEHVLVIGNKETLPQSKSAVDVGDKRPSNIGMDDIEPLPEIQFDAMQGNKVEETKPLLDHKEPIVQAISHTVQESQESILDQQLGCKPVPENLLHTALESKDGFPEPSDSCFQPNCRQPGSAVQTRQQLSPKKLQADEKVLFERQVKSKRGKVKTKSGSVKGVYDEWDRSLEYSEFPLSPNDQTSSSKKAERGSLKRPHSSEKENLALVETQPSAAKDHEDHAPSNSVVPPLVTESTKKPELKKLPQGLNEAFGSSVPQDTKSNQLGPPTPPLTPSSKGLSLDTLTLTGDAPEDELKSGKTDPPNVVLEPSLKTPLSKSIEPGEVSKDQDQILFEENLSGFPISAVDEKCSGHGGDMLVVEKPQSEIFGSMVGPQVVFDYNFNVQEVSLEPTKLEASPKIEECPERVLDVPASDTKSLQVESVTVDEARTLSRLSNEEGIKFTPKVKTKTAPSGLGARKERPSIEKTEKSKNEEKTKAPEVLKGYMRPTKARGSSAPPPQPLSKAPEKPKLPKEPRLRPDKGKSEAAALEAKAGSDITAPPTKDLPASPEKKVKASAAAAPSKAPATPKTKPLVAPSPKKPVSLTPSQPKKVSSPAPTATNATPKRPLGSAARTATPKETKEAKPKSLEAKSPVKTPDKKPLTSATTPRSAVKASPAASKLHTSTAANTTATSAPKPNLATKRPTSLKNDVKAAEAKKTTATKSPTELSRPKSVPADITKSNGAAPATRPKTSKPATSKTLTGPSTSADAKKLPAARPAPLSKATTAAAAKPSSASSASRPTAAAPKPRPATAPDLKNVRSKIGSTDNLKHQPGGGKQAKVEKKPVPVSTARKPVPAPTKTASTKPADPKETAQKQSNGKVQIVSKKVNYSHVQSKCGSKDNIKHVPGGGNVQILNKKVDVSKVSSKCGSKPSAKAKTGAGDAKPDDSAKKTEATKQESVKENGGDPIPAPQNGDLATPTDSAAMDTRENGVEETLATDGSNQREIQSFNSLIPETSI
ncbi:uncharacterized protein [Engystomops pustulosus]|uniref:uncharacterized protein isoform X4 n=1 Tax=Engystomops pustulosus TaxID=76066 RepID=UPI003AFABC9B